jgi:HSP20 family protein
MNTVSVLKIRDRNQPGPLLQDTLNLLDDVRNRAFELFQRRGGVPGNDMDDWLTAEREIFQVPRMEIAENEGEYQIQLGVPGFDAKDIRVAALPDALIVEGEAEHEYRSMEGNVRVSEFGERKLFRHIPLPEPVDVDHVSATLDEGLLRLRAAKAHHGSSRAAA